MRSVGFFSTAPALRSQLGDTGEGYFVFSKAEPVEEITRHTRSKQPQGAGSQKATSQAHVAGAAAATSTGSKGSSKVPSSPSASPGPAGTSMRRSSSVPAHMQAARGDKGGSSGSLDAVLSEDDESGLDEVALSEHKAGTSTSDMSHHDEGTASVPGSLVDSVLSEGSGTGTGLQAADGRAASPSPPQGKGGDGVMSWVWPWGKLPKQSSEHPTKPTAGGAASFQLQAAQRRHRRRKAAARAPPRRKLQRRHSTGSILQTGDMVRDAMPQLAYTLAAAAAAGTALPLPPLPTPPLPPTAMGGVAGAASALRSALVMTGVGQQATAVAHGGGRSADGTRQQDTFFVEGSVGESLTQPHQVTPHALHAVANALTALISSSVPGRSGSGGDLLLRPTHPRLLLAKYIQQGTKAAARRRAVTSDHVLSALPWMVTHILAYTPPPTAAALPEQPLDLPPLEQSNAGGLHLPPAISRPRSLSGVPGPLSPCVDLFAALPPSPALSPNLDLPPLDTVNGDPQLYRMSQSALSPAAGGKLSSEDISAGTRAVTHIAAPSAAAAAVVYPHHLPLDKGLQRAMYSTADASVDQTNNSLARHRRPPSTERPAPPPSFALSPSLTPSAAALDGSAALDSLPLLHGGGLGAAALPAGAAAGGRSLRREGGGASGGDGGGASNRAHGWRFGSWWLWGRATGDSDGEEDGDIAQRSNTDSDSDAGGGVRQRTSPHPQSGDDSDASSTGAGASKHTALTKEALASLSHSDSHSEASDEDVASIATYESLDAERREELGGAPSGYRMKRYKTMRPTTEQLQTLGLQRGKNSLSFVVWDRAEIAAADAYRVAMQEHRIRVREHERLEEKLRCRNAEMGGVVVPPKIAPPAPPKPPSAVAHATVSCDLYLWRPNTRVVISDVDGTITKSDALGHVFYWMGRDWTHDGVAQLYQNIVRNGYEILYLTSRAIGQVGATKNYLFQNVRQPRRYLAGLTGLGTAGTPEPAAAGSRRKAAPSDSDPLGEGYLRLRGDYTPGSAYTKAYSAAPPSPARPSAVASPQGTPGRKVVSVPAPPVPPGPAAGHAPLESAPATSLARAAAQAVQTQALAPSASQPPAPGAGHVATQSEPMEVLESAVTPLDPRTVALPPGPVITSPDRLIQAFTREVVHRQPQKFKIQALSDILNLFPADDAPFVAGFGNRDTDAIAYRAVRIPPHRVFIINPEGTVRVGGGGRMAGRKCFTGSYWALNDMVNELFPPVCDASSSGSQGAGSHVGRPLPVQAAYSDVTFWRKPLPAIVDSDDES